MSLESLPVLNPTIHSGHPSIQASCHFAGGIQSENFEAGKSRALSRMQQEVPRKRPRLAACDPPIIDLQWISMCAYSLSSGTDGRTLR